MIYVAGGARSRRFSLNDEFPMVDGPGEYLEYLARGSVDSAVPTSMNLVIGQSSVVGHSILSGRALYSWMPLGRLSCCCCNFGGPLYYIGECSCLAEFVEV